MHQPQRQLLIVALIQFAVIANHHEPGCDASVQVHHQSAQGEYFVNEPAQEKKEQLEIPGDQTLIVRLPSNPLLKYTSYKDVSILHFRIPPDTRTAFFTFKAFEETKSAFHRKCKPREVTLHLKASSYPVISPENITFPRNFLNANQRFRVHDLQFRSDEIQQRITVEGPYVGNWFAVAFVSWTDPNNDRIEQQGLATTCETLLLAEMSVSRFHPIIVNNGQIHNSNLTSNSDEQSPITKQNTTQNDDDKNSNHSKSASSTSPPDTAAKSKPNSKASDNSSNSTTNNEIIYKFYVPRNIGVATAYITIASECLHCPDVGFHVQANAFPCTTGRSDDSHYIHSTIITPNHTDEVPIEFYVQPSAWHYALLKFETATNETSALTLDEVKLFEKLKMSSSSLHLGYKESEHIGSQQERLHTQQRMKRQKSNIRETIWYRVEYSLHIDFHEPLPAEEGPTPSEKQKGVLETTSEKNDGKLKVNPDYSPKNDTATENSDAWRPVLFRNMEFYPLLRQTYREFFMFDYDLVPDVNGTIPTVLNLTAGTPAGFAFELGEVYDIGGTLSFAVSMNHGLKGLNDFKTTPTMTTATERSGILAEKLIGGPITSHDTKTDDSNGETLPRSNQTIIVCMHHGEPGVPMWPDKCRYGRKLIPASSIVNNTDSNTSTGLVHVPFPESGQWYVTMGLYCHGAETAARVTIIDSVKEFVRKHASMLDTMRQTCACVNGATAYQTCVNDRKCLAAMNETETLKVKECLMDSKCTSNYLEMTRKFEIHHKLATEQHFALDNCNTSVVFTISSSPCVAGRCGRFGRCYHYMSGGFVFSTCVCTKGYRGWDCTEDSQIPSNMTILLASLLLILSNLLFIPSVYMALHRKYYTEAVIYFFAMFFSIFYHACDSGEDEYSFCLVKIGVLQFCDFYCGLLAIWVTLVAMSHIRIQFVSLLHMLGAILLAFGTELNKQSLWVFLAPALTGICIISASWGLRCHKSGKCFPSRRYRTVYMPLGAVLVMVGLVCFAFLQTKQNYHIVHSVWHMVMALSILCLLPSRNSFIPKC